MRMFFKERGAIIVVASLVLLNLLIYFNGIGNDFVWDDSYLVKENYYIRDAGNLKKLLVMEDKPSSFSATGYFRPFTNLTFLLDYQIFKGRAYGFRLTNIAFHIASVIALFFLVSIITKNNLLSFVTAVIFSAQAVHVEAVTFISGRNNVICALFILLSLYYYIKSGEGLLRSRSVAHNDRWLIYSMLFLFLGAATKEFAYMLPFIFIFYDYNFDPDFSIKKRINAYAAAFFTLGIFVIYRAIAVPLAGSLPLKTETLYKRIINTFQIFVNYIRNQIFPESLSIYFNLPLSDSFFAPPIIVSFLTLLVLIILIFLLRKREKVLFFSFFTYLILLMPASNIIEIPGALMADRWLYPASAFFALFLARLILLAFSKKKSLIPITTVAFAGFLSFFAIQRNYVFKSDFALFSDMLKIFPNSAVAHNNLGVEYKEMGDVDNAERQYLMAIECDPKYNLPYNNLATIYSSRNQKQRAIKFLKKAYELNSAYALTAYNLGVSYKELGNIEESNKFYNIAISLNPDIFDAYYNLAANYYKAKEYEKTLETLKKAEKVPTEEKNKKEIKNKIKMVSDIIEKQKLPK